MSRKHNGDTKLFPRASLLYWRLVDFVSNHSNEAVVDTAGLWDVCRVATQVDLTEPLIQQFETLLRLGGVRALDHFVDQGAHIAWMKDHHEEA